MPLQLRAILTTLAALLSGVLATLCLTNPVVRDWAIVASPAEVDRWVGSGPTSIALGAVVAVGACAWAQHRGSRRATWISIVGAVVVLAVIRAGIPEISVLDLLISVLVLKSIAAGVVLGCAVAVSWDRPGTRNAVLLGVIATFLSIRTFAGEAGLMSTSAVGEPSWWLLGATAVVAIACAVTAHAGFRIRRADAGEIRIAMVVVVALAIGHRVLGALIDSQRYASEITAWVVMALAAGAALALTSLAAYRLGHTSGAGGTFLWAATALAAASAPVFVDIAERSGHWDDLRSPWVLVLAAALAVAIALRLHRHVPRIVVFALLLAVPVSDLLPFDSAHGAWAIMVKVVALSFAGAALLASTAPGSLVDATLGCAILFASMTFSSIAVLTDRLASPLWSVPTYLREQFGPETTGAHSDIVMIPVDYVSAPSVGAALLFAAIVGVCAAAGRTPSSD